MNEDKRTVYTAYCEEIKKTICELGIGKGSIVYISSDATRIVSLAKKELGFAGKEDRDLFLNILVDTLKDIVTEEGTLLFPMYNWDFCKGIKYSGKTAKSKVGALNNFVLENRPDFKRTRHPLYSFMVWGKDANYLCSLDNHEAFGNNSPFAYLDKNGGVQLCLSVDLAGSVTYFHYVEQKENVPYRHHKFFMGEYEQENGETEYRVYSQFVRDLVIDPRFIMTDSIFEEDKVIKTAEVYGWEIRTASFADIEAVIKKAIAEGAVRIYEFGNEEALKAVVDEETVYEIGYLKSERLL